MMHKAPAFWYHNGASSLLLAGLLSPLGWLYSRIVAYRLARHKPQRLHVPVLCVGNNSVGGTGKTPLVIYCAQLLQQQGKNPHVISRGYGGTAKQLRRVDADKDCASEVGDEPLLIAKHAPCWVASKRLDAALAAIADGADCILMDDGLQNPTLHKDCSILVVDGAVGFGNKHCLPAGPCREPVAASLAKAQMIVLMGAPTHADAQALLATQDESLFQAQLTPPFGVIETLQAQSPYVAFCGIGRPQKFFETLQSYAIAVTETKAFPDHHMYSEATLQRLEQRAQAQSARLITTEKDWLRLPEAWRAKVAYLPVSVQLQDAEHFAAHLVAALFEGHAP
jgi:tetraacyldisaccharide 4'-kinase